MPTLDFMVVPDQQAYTLTAFRSNIPNTLVRRSGDDFVVEFPSGTFAPLGSLLIETRNLPLVTDQTRVAVRRMMNAAAGDGSLTYRLPLEEYDVWRVALAFRPAFVLT